MVRTLDALKVCAGKIAHRGVAAGRYVATEACRQRRIARCSSLGCARRSGIEIEIISTAEEARLVVAGCAPLLDPRIPYAIVFDIGGGSTEIVWLRLAAAPGAARDPRLVSLPFGVVTFTERFGGTEVIAGDLPRDGRRGAWRRLAPFERRHDIRAQCPPGRCRCSAAPGR